MTSKHLKKLAADSNVLLSAVIGKAALKVFTHLDIEIVTTEFNIDEIKEYLPYMASKYNLDKTKLILQLNMLPIHQKKENYYKSKIQEAKKYLEDRDIDDVHLGALALKEKIPLWTNDKDFTNFPVSVYPTAQLLKKFGL